MQVLRTIDMVQAVRLMSDLVIQNEVYFCELDSAAGDGDFGMSLAKGFKLLLNEWDQLPQENIGVFLRQCGTLLAEHCGGASGPIWGSAFRGAGKSALGKTAISLAELAGLFQSAVDAIQKIGNAKLGDKTLLDALIPATASLTKSGAAGSDLAAAMKLAAQEATAGAERTKGMVASRGRASYVGQRSLTFPDAGAVAIAFLFSAIADQWETLSASS